MIAKNLVDLIGNTPLVELNNLNKNPHVKLLAKLEGNNPGGSVKDRPALYMIKGAEEQGLLKPGVKLIEPTSGNTGIALAMIAKLKGYEIELVMPSNASVERVQTMSAFGAKVILTPAERSMEGAIDYARAKVAQGGYLMLDQFSNPHNYTAHYKTTAPEIDRDTQGGITHFVASMGTTGTLMGCSRYFKENRPSVQIIGAQPTPNSNIPGIRRWPTEYLPKIFDSSRLDQTFDVSQKDAILTTRRLAEEEGIFAGMSSGGNVWVALEVCKNLKSGMVVVIICDRGDRYLSTDLFPAPV